MAIAAEMHVEFEHRGPHFDGPLEGAQGVLRLVGRGAPVGDVVDHAPPLEDTTGSAMSCANAMHPSISDLNHETGYELDSLPGSGHTAEPVQQNLRVWAILG